jgi:hypothetical protein
LWHNAPGLRAVLSGLTRDGANRPGVHEASSGGARLVDLHSQHTGRTSHGVYVSTLYEKSQLAKVSHSKKKGEGGRGSVAGRKRNKGG